MKVGTDGVLLGSWTRTNDAQRILDVGTGTGLLALMMAQRCDAAIDAVEIDELACEEAKFNFEQSAWCDRLKVFHTDFTLFADMPCVPYDLILSNPPFFSNSLKTNDPTLAIARHNDKLSFNNFLNGTHKLLNKKGRFCVILPFISSMEFRGLARLAGFYLRYETRVSPKLSEPPKRVLLEFSREVGYPVYTELAILDEKGFYSENYKILTSPYYLAF